MNTRKAGSLSVKCDDDEAAQGALDALRALGVDSAADFHAKLDAALEGAANATTLAEM